MMRSRSPLALAAAALLLTVSIGAAGPSADDDGTITQVATQESNQSITQDADTDAGTVSQTASQESTQDIDQEAEGSGDVTQVADQESTQELEQDGGTVDDTDAGDEALVVDDGEGPGGDDGEELEAEGETEPQGEPAGEPPEDAVVDHGDAKALRSHPCKDHEVHFVINQLKGLDAPDTIQVTWADGSTATIHRDKLTPGGVAHFWTTLNLDEPVVRATADLPEDWRGNFNLSHGPCFEDR